MVKIPHTIAKFKRARTTFFSSEASKRLHVILKDLSPDDLVFGTNEDPHYAETTKEANLNHALKKIGLDMRYDDTNWHKINTHSFRAYFITKVSRHDHNMTKKLSGEKGYLLQYDRMTNEEYIEFYEKIESDLFIFDLTKKNQKIKDLENEKSENELLKAQLDKIQEDLDKVKQWRELEQKYEQIKK
jgi:hypothetical protein